MKATTRAEGHRLLLLVAALAAAIVIPPYVGDGHSVGKVWSLLSSLAMLAALLLLAGKGNWLFSLFVLLIPTLVTSWITPYTEGNWAIYADHATNILYFSLVGLYLIRMILQTTTVNANAIYAAICLYMILAWIWGSVYTLHFVYDPESFVFNHQALHALATDPKTTSSLFHYYSFITLTTVGYGDISPLSRSTQAWVSLEAMLGQLYLAIIIARLVSSYQAAERNEGAS